MPTQERSCGSKNTRRLRVSENDISKDRKKRATTSTDRTRVRIDQNNTGHADELWSRATSRKMTKGVNLNEENGHRREDEWKRNNKGERASSSQLFRVRKSSITR